MSCAASRAIAVNNTWSLGASAVTRADPARVLHCAARAGGAGRMARLVLCPPGFTGLWAPGTGAEAVNLQIS